MEAQPLDRLPLANIPKVKKPRQPMRRKKDLSHSGPKAFITSTTRTKPMRKVGKRGLRQMKDKKAALDLYFKNHGEVGSGGWMAKCQITGILCRREEVHPCHKKRASAMGGEAPENIVCGHWKAHRWLDGAGSKSDRERFLRASPVNCRVGGVIAWPAELKALLEKAMGLPIPGPENKEQP